MCSRNAVLCGLRKEFVGEFTEPGLEHGTDDVDIIEVILLKQIDVTLCVALADD
jgi:hypothetical protein